MKRGVSLCIGGTATAVALGLFLYRDRAPEGIVPAGPNPFVSDVVIEQIGEDATPFADTINIPATQGIYAVVRFKTLSDVPATFEEREVCAVPNWPVTLAVYRLGAPDGPGACEFHCEAPGRAVARTSAMPRQEGPPAVPPPMGTSSLWSRSAGFVGTPRMPTTPADENAYWTFLVAPDRQRPAGEYVYEVRLYPTTRWISPFRIDIGDPVVLKRGLLLAADDADRSVTVP